jgi:hypothetical protein
MATKLEYAELKEFNNIAKSLLNKHTDIFPLSDIDTFTDKIKCVSIINKSRDDKDHYTIKGVADPIRMFCTCSYVITVYNEDWENYTDNQKQLLVFCILRRIPLSDSEDGKLLALDYKDDSLMVRTFGPDWLTNNELPSLLTSNIEWKV